MVAELETDPAHDNRRVANAGRRSAAHDGRSGRGGDGPSA